MTIDQASFEPVYRQLARILREQILVGELPPGEALPSESALSQLYGVGRDAVRDAIASLRHDGLVTTLRGLGTFVRTTAPDVAVVRARAGTRVAARVATTDERLRFGLPEGTAMLVLTRAGLPDELLPADRTVVEFDDDLRISACQARGGGQARCLALAEPGRRVGAGYSR